MKKIIFLTEGGKKKGFGHLGRCIPIYNAFKKIHFKTKIYVHSDVKKIQILNNKNYEIVNWQNSIHDISNAIQSADLVILDCLSISKKNYTFLLHKCKKILIIDDRDKQVYKNNEIIVDWSIFSEKKVSLGNCTYIRGAKYAPLRECFKKKDNHKIRKNIIKIIITSGGSDQKNILLLIANKLGQNYPKINFKVLIGLGFPALSKIKKLKKINNVKLIFSPSDKKIVSSIRSCDVAIASGGHSIYELARLGVPTIHFLVNKNQRVAEKWKETGFTYFVGWYDKKNFMQKISKALSKIQSIKKRKLMSKSGQNLIKTNGANLIVAKLAKLI